MEDELAFEAVWRKLEAAGAGAGETRRVVGMLQTEYPKARLKPRGGFGSLPEHCTMPTVLNVWNQTTQRKNYCPTVKRRGSRGDSTSRFEVFNKA